MSNAQNGTARLEDFHALSDTPRGDCAMRTTRNTIAKATSIAGNENQAHCT